MNSISCSQTRGGGDGKRETPREVRQNDGSGKERLKDFTKEFSMKGRKRKSLGMFL